MNREQGTTIMCKLDHRNEGREVDIVPITVLWRRVIVREKGGRRNNISNAEMANMGYSSLVLTLLKNNSIG